MTTQSSAQEQDEFETLRAEIAGAVRRACGAALAAQAEDLAHEVLLRVLERGEGNPARDASYWRKAAYHVVVDEIRRRRRRREDALEDFRPNAEPAAATVHNPERRAAGRQLGEAIGDCVKRLSETRRLPVVLFLQGHSVPESAALLGWAEKRAESGLYRGLRDLRNCLSVKGWSR